MSSLPRFLRRELERRAEGDRQRRLTRLAPQSVCDYCGVGKPASYYDAEPIVLLRDERERALVFALEADVQDDPRPVVHHYDRGWLACDGCDPYVRRNDIEGLIRHRFRNSPATRQQYGHLDERGLAEVTATLRGVWGLVFATKRGPERIFD